MYTVKEDDQRKPSQKVSVKFYYLLKPDKGSISKTVIGPFNVQKYFVSFTNHKQIQSRKNSQ